MKNPPVAFAGFLAVAGLTLGLTLPIAAQTFEPNWESLDSRPIPEWFGDAKFGIFIHWVSSVSSSTTPIRHEAFC